MKEGGVKLKNEDTLLSNLYKRDYLNKLDIEIICLLLYLNSEGKTKAKEYISNLVELEKYQLYKEKNRLPKEQTEDK